MNLVTLSMVWLLVPDWIPKLLTLRSFRGYTECCAKQNTHQASVLGVDGEQKSISP